MSSIRYIPVKHEIINHVIVTVSILSTTLNQAHRLLLPDMNFAWHSNTLSLGYNNNSFTNWSFFSLLLKSLSKL